MSSPAPHDPTSGPPPYRPQPYSGDIVPAPASPAPSRAVGGPPAGTRTARRLRLGGGWVFWVSLVLGLLLAALTVASIVQVATTGSDALGDAQRQTGQEQSVTVSDGDRVGVFAAAGTPVDGVCTISDGGAVDQSLTLLPGAGVRYGGEQYQLLGSWTAPADGTFSVQCDQDGLLTGDAQPVSQLPWWTTGIVVGALGTVAALLPLLIGGVLWLAGKVHRDLVR